MGQPATLEPRTAEEHVPQGGESGGPQRDRRRDPGALGGRSRASGVPRIPKGFTTQMSHTHRGKERVPSQSQGRDAKSGSCPEFPRNSPFQIFYCTVHTIKYP